MVKKRVTPKKPARRKKAAKAAKSRPRADRSRLDLAPLQKHIRQRIKDLKDRKPEAAAAREGESSDETIARLESALETLEDICFPTMDIPI